MRAGGSDQTLYFHADNLGSIDTISSDQQPATHQRFDPFGAPIGTPSSLTRAGFTGHEHDNDLGLIDMKGRVYDPLGGRFTSADPMMQSPFSSQGLNRYSYVRNDPVNFSDPSGFLSTKEFFGGFFVAMMVVDIALLGDASGLFDASLTGAAEGVGINLGTQAAINALGGGGNVGVGGGLPQSAVGGGPPPSRIEFMPNVSDDFKNEYTRALRHLGSHGTNLLAKIETNLRKTKQYLFIRPGTVHKYTPGAHIVDWNAHLALRINGKGDSPALALLHELGHAAREIGEPGPYKADLSLADPSGKFPNLEERRVVLTIENPAARALGEATRPDYYTGDDYYVEHADLVQ